mmetsp:Transcript_3763/g.5839  ORF Transcript_3763/g.5839 Transcript_3763/m.5839 type:complete len:455 (-) Transcript_3763:268-1632(-)|eukprot:CAMPEP_0185035022 /NCGR_PEP_ID=MMETSP1103-20130426/25684_1 /TAXON_ID=36769 /ORGANISM="Paraphysomonas bandaiensis, Strain Caron Lab Isolate" /LENGTH=454 /DNA_ID=CAMNT_0027571925 /DNA_START=7 /DNA_END=1371 /DNA_ORIENTATION=-
MTIHCCIVDDHCDIIPFLHSCYRINLLPSSNVSLIHIDSHPDLVPPADTLSSLSDTSHLYTLMESNGSISEFILPLIVNGHVSHIVWLCPYWSDQFNAGHYQFLIGDNSDGLAAVTCQEPYYYDEGLVYDQSELTHTCSVDLSVCCTDSDYSFNASSCNSNGWILDICLDYFTVSNPFLVDLESNISAYNCPEDTVEILREMYLSVRFRSKLVTHDEKYSSSTRRKEQKEFRNLVDDLLSETSSDCRCVPGVDVCELHKVARSRRERFLSLFNCTCESDAAEREQVTCLGKCSGRRPAQRFISLIDSLDGPMRTAIRENDITMIATLPHHESSWDEIEELMKSLAEFINSCVQHFGSGPKVICIARSDGDGYTDNILVDRIQSRVLQMLQTISKHWPSYDRSETADPITVHDIRVDPYVRCRELFIDKRVLSGGNMSISAKKRKLLEESGFKFS